ncbi:hypothetical protein ACC691_39685, partial [Rhizobium johnstonii]|uniref:hypothetical protein n=1 Tax=Rhizobium johnstonii TaxID=3019933 RepID=UPI003F9449DC
VMPSDTAGAIYEQVVRFIGDTTLAVAVLSTTVAVIGWLSSGFRPAVALRRIFASWIESLRLSAERHHVTTGSFGEWLYRWRIAVR